VKFPDWPADRAGLPTFATQLYGWRDVLLSRADDVPDHGGRPVAGGFSERDMLVHEARTFHEFGAVIETGWHESGIEPCIRGPLTPFGPSDEFPDWRTYQDWQHGVVGVREEPHPSPSWWPITVGRLNATLKMDWPSRSQRRVLARLLDEHIEAGRPEWDRYFAPDPVFNGSRWVEPNPRKPEPTLTLERPPTSWH